MKSTKNLALLLLLLGSSKLAATPSLSALSYYTVVTTHDLVHINSLNGRALIGGSLTESNSFTLGNSLVSGTPSSQETLIVMGNMASGGLINMQKGSVGIGGTTNSRGINFNGGGSVMTDTTDYSSVFTDLTDASTALKNLSSNSSYTLPSGQPAGLNFIASPDANGLAVFNVSGSDIFSNNYIQSLDFTDNGATPRLQRLWD